jgi:hypothetical protein
MTRNRHLVGSTAMSAQLDADEWRGLVGAYRDVASVVVTEMSVKSQNEQTP